jgi:hypothetical protein
MEHNIPNSKYYKDAHEIVVVAKIGTKRKG